jgi:hypothetical protein
MARGKKLLDRLYALEQDYRALIVKVCLEQLAHRFSRAANRALVPIYLQGKYWRDVEASRLEYIEKEIRSLRHKLAMPLGPSVISSIDQLRDGYGRASNGERRKLLNDFVAQQCAATGRVM